MNLPGLRDLGLTYEQAAHGVQTAKAMDLEAGVRSRTKKFEPKHMRTGIDLSKAQQSGLARLLMEKGLFTADEYCEAMRLAVNEELASEQDALGGAVELR